ncbi:MAG: ATP-binding protein, partial [Planctomycetota bacterium]
MKEAEVKLIDFGLVGRQRTGSTATVPGTIHYIAPEIFKGLHIDRRSDLYSLGILLYQIATGNLPYDGATQLEVIRGHFEGGAISPREIRSDLPEGLEHVILRLMAREPWERFSSANAVIGALNETFQTDLALETKETQESYILTGRFVGRDAEFSRLKHALARTVGHTAAVPDDYRFRPAEGAAPSDEEATVDEGRRPVLLVTGDPGIGKTRLMKEFKTFSQLQGVLFLEGDCSPGRAIPFGPFLPILRELVRIREGSALLPRFASELVKVLPEIADLVEIPPSVPLKPEQERMRLIHALSRFLLEVSEAKPFVFHLADLHWADDITLELVTYLTRGLEWPPGEGGVEEGEGDALAGLYGPLCPRLLLCATVQTMVKEEGGFHETWDALLECGAEALKLRGLEKPEVSSLLRSMLGMDRDPEELAEVIQTRTGGNPFFVEEVMKSLVEEGALYCERGRWSAKADSLEQIDIPEGVSDVINQRLERLSGGEKEVVRLVSVFNGPAPVPVLLHARGRDMAVLLADLAGLVEKDILFVEEMRDGERGYVFTHQSMKRAAYDGMALRSRRALHRRVGKAFEEEYGKEATPFLEEMATHFIRGRDQRRAFDYAVRAGEKARKMHANREALDFYLAAMEFATAQEVDSGVHEEIAGLHEVVGELDHAVEKYRGLLDLKGAEITPESAVRIRRRLAEALRKQ